MLKFGDRTQIGAVHLATSLVADLQLIAAALVWAYAVYISVEGLTAAATASVVSLSGGALLANIVSVVLLVVETVSFHRALTGVAVGNPLLDVLVPAVRRDEDGARRAGPRAGSPSPRPRRRRPRSSWSCGGCAPR